MAKNRKLTIIISGMAASGKSTLAENLARKFRLKFYTGSDALRDLAKKIGYNPKGVGWWDTEEGIGFLNERKTNYSFDRKTDGLMLEKAKRGGIVMTSWTLPYLGCPGIKIWIKASKKKRTGRMSRRDKISLAEAKSVVGERDRKNTALYIKIYGFTIGKKLEKFYDIIIDSNKIDEKQVFEKIVEIINEKYL